MRFHSFYLDKPASGKAKQREDGVWEHTYVRKMSDPYFMVSCDMAMCLNEEPTPIAAPADHPKCTLQCNIQLAPSEKAEGKPACMFWRSVPISDHAVIRLQPALPPLENGPASSQSSWTAEHAAGAVWATEGYLQVNTCLKSHQSIKSYILCRMCHVSQQDSISVMIICYIAAFSDHNRNVDVLTG